MKPRLAFILLVALLPLALDGCVSMRVTPIRGQEPSHLEVSVFENASARDAGRPLDHPVFTHLFRVEGSREVSVARSLASRWRADGLADGTYRLEATREIDDRGDIRELPSGGAAKTFRIGRGESVRVEVLRHKVPVALIVVSAITVVALAVLAIVLEHEGKLPKPPLPPPLPVPVDVAVAFDWTFVSRADRGPSPVVADVFPARGSVVAARRVAVTFLLTTPLDGEPDPEAVSALGSRSGGISGTTSYLVAEQLLRFAPSRDFAPGETVTVTLELGKLRSASGTAGAGRVSTSFRVPRD